MEEVFCLEPGHQFICRYSMQDKISSLVRSSRFQNLKYYLKHFLSFSEHEVHQELRSSFSTKGGKNIEVNEQKPWKCPHPIIFQTTLHINLYTRTLKFGVLL